MDSVTILQVEEGYSQPDPIKNSVRPVSSSGKKKITGRIMAFLESLAWESDDEDDSRFRNLISHTPVEEGSSEEEEGPIELDSFRTKNKWRSVVEQMIEELAPVDEDAVSKSAKTGVCSVLNRELARGNRHDPLLALMHWWEEFGGRCGLSTRREQHLAVLYARLLLADAAERPDSTHRRDSATHIDSVLSRVEEAVYVNEPTGKRLYANIIELFHLRARCALELNGDERSVAYYTRQIEKVHETSKMTGFPAGVETTHGSFTAF